MEKRNKKMPYHLTITDNETGETLRELDFDCLIGAVHLSEKESGGIFLANSSILAQAETIAATEVTVKQALDKDADIRRARATVAAEIIEENFETKETEN